MHINDKSCPCEYSTVKCAFYTLDLNIESGFKTADENVNYLLFTIAGEIQITSNLFEATTVHSDEIIFIPRTNLCQCTTRSNAHLLIHVFDNSLCLSEFCIMNKFRLTKKQLSQIDQFFILSSNSVIKNYINGILLYIEEDKRRTIENSIWHLKHKELIRLFRYSYHYSELHFFFYSVEKYVLPFKTKVLQHYPNAYSAKELANLCGYGLSTFQRIFHKEFGKTVYQWMLEQKSSHILYKIQHSDVSFKEIIHEYNFSSHAHFCRFCKKYLNGTPTSLRKMAKTENKDEKN